MSGNLTPRKRKAVLSLVEHGSVTQAAESCGLSRQTLYRWLAEPEFSQALREASSQMVEQASRELTASMGEAVSVLRALLQSRSEHQRRLAADSILSHQSKLRELVELEQRVSLLERKDGKRHK